MNNLIKRIELHEIFLLMCYINNGGNFRGKMQIAKVTIDYRLQIDRLYIIDYYGYKLQREATIKGKI